MSSHNKVWIGFIYKNGDISMEPILMDYDTANGYHIDEFNIAGCNGLGLHLQSELIFFTSYFKKEVEVFLLGAKSMHNKILKIKSEYDNLFSKEYSLEEK